MFSFDVSTSIKLKAMVSLSVVATWASSFLPPVGRTGLTALCLRPAVICCSQSDAMRQENLHLSQVTQVCCPGTNFNVHLGFKKGKTETQIPFFFLLGFGPNTILFKFQRFKFHQSRICLCKITYQMFTAIDVVGYFIANVTLADSTIIN